MPTAFSRRGLLLAPALAAAQSQRPAVRSGYVDWSWDRWREITKESRPAITSDQTGKAALSDLLDSADWATRRARLRQVLDVFLGQAPQSKPPLEAKIVKEEDAGDHHRRHVLFQTETGEFVPGFLLIPKQRRGRLPALIVPHQTTQEARKEPAGLAGNPRMHIALELVRRGYAAFTYDAMCFGERHDPGSGHYGDAIPFYRKHPEWSVIGKMAWDLSRAVDYLQTLDLIDPARIGSIGHSHGGYTTLIAMALDERIRAGVSSCGFETFRHDGNVWRWSHATALLPRLGFYISSPHINMRNYAGVQDSETPQTPFDMHWVLGLIAPRPLFLSTSDEDAIFPNAGWSARMALARLEPVYRLHAAESKLESYYFRGGHGFPVEAANRAYGFLDRWMKA
ncbi:MAG: prolyl oligopeptidase family serine peptidase [Acidobacteria bacterium]|nr:prolyl oligopeptidase family serine peptidase [Acidobacteriota bacterium]